jgi:hypothetical protein
MTMKDQMIRKVHQEEAMTPSSAAQKYRNLIASIVIPTVAIILPQRSLMSASEQQNVIHQL